mgnify:CR=1 FL=1
MRYTLLILLLGLIISCTSRYKGMQLSSVTINDKKANKLIIDRFPDYGDGHKDGCVVMAEMRLNLTVNKNGHTSGQVTDVSSGEPLHKARIELKNKLKQTYIVNTDSVGQFATNLSAKLTDLQVNYIGYRPLTIKLK